MMLDAAQALGWRLERQFLATERASSVVEVVDRVLAVRGWPSSVADLACGVRLGEPVPGTVDRALGDGDLVRTYLFGGGSYVVTPHVAAVLSTVRTTSGVWQTARFQRQGGFVLDDWEPLRAAVLEALADGPLTRPEIAARLAEVPGLAAVRPGALGAGADTLYKPLFWFGDIAFGPSRDGQATFRALTGRYRLPDRPEVDDAGRRAIEWYLGAYGPATQENLRYWLAAGLSAPRRRLLEWLADLGDAVTTVTIDGADHHVLTRDLDALADAATSEEIRLLPAHDPWISNAGTADARIVPPAHRQDATRGANPVLRGGVVAGTWRIDRQTLTVRWYSEAGPVPRAALDRAAAELATIREEESGLELARPTTIRARGAAGRIR